MATPASPSTTPFNRHKHNFALQEERGDTQMEFVHHASGPILRVSQAVASSSLEQVKAYRVWIGRSVKQMAEYPLSSSLLFDTTTYIFARVGDKFYARVQNSSNEPTKLSRKHPKQGRLFDPS